jgi:hypothetical protein
VVIDEEKKAEAGLSVMLRNDFGFVFMRHAACLSVMLSLERLRQR